MNHSAVVLSDCMQGNCTSEQLPGFAKPSELGGSVLADVKPPQCVIVTDAAAINVGEGDLWMGNLFMRVKYTARSAAITASASRNISSPGAAVMHVDSGARLWATDVTIQGHGDEKTVQALAAQGPVLCSGVQPQTRNELYNFCVSFSCS